MNRRGQPSKHSGADSERPAGGSLEQKTTGRQNDSGGPWQTDTAAATLGPRGHWQVLRLRLPGWPGWDRRAAQVTEYMISSPAA